VGLPTKQKLVNTLNLFYGDSVYSNFNTLSAFQKELGVLLSINNPPTKQDIINNLNTFYTQLVYTDFNTIPLEEVRFSALMWLVDNAASNSDSIENMPQSNITKSYIAATNVVAYKAVRVNDNNQLIYADNDFPQVTGISTESGNTNQAILVATSGSVYSASWNWDTSKLVYVGNNGELIQIAPTEGYVIEVGNVIDSNTINIDVEVIAI
jgi:hypothetical protein